MHPPPFRRVLVLFIIGLACASPRVLARDPPPRVPAPATPAPAPAPPAPAKLSQLEWLLGEWQGVALFPKRTGYVHKRFALDVGGKFLTERTTDLFPPDQKDSLDYELHQDLIVYYPRGDTVAMKGFFVEGFVESATLVFEDEGRKVVIESTAIENGPPGMRVRFTLTRTSDATYEQTFEMASATKPWRQIELIKMRRILR